MPSCRIMINVKLFAIDTVIIKCFSQNLTEFERLPNPVLAEYALACVINEESSFSCCF